MDSYISVSVSWRSTPLSLLEQVAVGGEDGEALQRGALGAGYAEAMVLSTCSRTELHVIHEGQADTTVLLEWLAGGDPAMSRTLAQVATVRTGPLAVEHLFRTAAGLESRALGEVEIQAQLRAAVRQAVGAVGEPHRLRRLVTAALHSARSGPGAALSKRRGLLARRAVARALHNATSTDRLQVVVLGAGTMGHQVLEALPAHRCRTVLVGRNPSAASATRPPVQPLDELPDLLGEADLVFVATSAGRHVLSRSAVREARRGSSRPVTFVDLSLPRNIDPGVTAEPGVTMLDLDDLTVEGLGHVTHAELRAAQEAADAGARSYLESLRVRRAGPAISALRARLEEVCLSKLRDSLKGSGLSEDALAETAGAIAAAVAHPSTMLLRQAAEQEDDDLLELVSHAFGVQVVSHS